MKEFMIQAIYIYREAELLKTFRFIKGIGLTPKKIDITKNTFRFRIREPILFNPKTYYTIKHKWMNFVVAKLK